MQQLSPSHLRGRHSDRTVIILRVRWYITYELGCRDLVGMTAERGVDVSRTTIPRWPQRSVPESEGRRRPYNPPAGSSWRVDGTYIRVRGRRTYLYRAVDKRGLTVDFRPSEDRDTPAAERFFTGAVEQHGAPEKITLDGYPATHSATAGLKAGGILHLLPGARTSAYLNNLVGRDRRRVKQRLHPMLGFEDLRNAAVTLSGVGPVRKNKKGQFDTAKFTDGAKVRVPGMWEAALAA